MNIELCDLCKNKEANKRFKVKMSRKGGYERTGYGMRWTDLWQPYEYIAICEDCAEKLFGIKSSKTLRKEFLDDCHRQLKEYKEKNTELERV